MCSIWKNSILILKRFRCFSIRLIITIGMFCSLRIQLADRLISIFQHIDRYVLPRSKSTQPTSALVTRRVKPIDLLNRIPQLKLQCLFPNIIIAIRIFLTLPVTVATGERSFSKLSFIKNKFRKYSTQNRAASLY